MIDTDDYRHAMGGRAKDPLLNYNWRDKPHRLVYDLCREIERLQEELEQMRARGGDRARMTCPLCPDAVEELPAARCITCGTGYYEEEER